MSEPDGEPAEGHYSTPALLYPMVSGGHGTIHDPETKSESKKEGGKASADGSDEYGRGPESGHEHAKEKSLAGDEIESGHG